jgi:hypothetical protein
MRGKLPLVLAGVVLVCVALGLGALPRLRRERLALIRLQNHIESAAAPDEPVLTDDRWLALAMRWTGSRAVTPPISVVGRDHGVEAFTRGRESLLVIRPQDPLVRSLRAAGYTLKSQTTDAAGTAWDVTGDGSGMCGHAGVRIFFVLPPAQATPQP